MRAGVDDIIFNLQEKKRGGSIQKQPSVQCRFNFRLLLDLITSINMYAIDESFRIGISDYFLKDLFSA